MSLLLFVSYMDRVWVRKSMALEMQASWSACSAGLACQTQQWLSELSTFRQHNTFYTVCYTEELIEELRAYIQQPPVSISHKDTNSAMQVRCRVRFQVI